MRAMSIKQYLAKGYEMSEERRKNLAERYNGFRYRARPDYNGGDASAWRRMVHQNGPGKPGLSVTHSRWGEDCDSHGIGCAETMHTLVHRDHAGAPVAYAKVEPDHYEEHGGKQYVAMMGSDRTRGVAHALAVGHIAHHLDKMGVEPSHDLSTYSQGLVSHGFELKETGRDAKLKNYLARRSARQPIQQRLFDKGYKASPASASAARASLGAGPAAVENVDEFAHDELSRVPRGKPGLSIHRNTYALGGGWHGPQFEHEERAHTIVYRDKDGWPVTSASIYGKQHHWGKPDRRVTSTMVSDRSRGALHAIGTAHVANAVDRLHANETKEMTHESQRMVAHSLDRPERTAKLRDYIARRAKRGN